MKGALGLCAATAVLVTTFLIPFSSSGASSASRTVGPAPSARRCLERGWKGRGADVFTRTTCNLDVKARPSARPTRRSSRPSDDHWPDPARH